jgi:arylsulfatase A-like enzyme
VLSLLLACAPPLPPGGERPDIVLVSIDTLRADHLGSYGYGRDTSPFLDQLAARGLRYSHARSPSPWTLPTHSTMLSGQLPVHHRVVDDSSQLGSETPLLQETLAQAGYATIGVTSTFFVGRRFGFDRGFDHFEDFELTKKTNNAGTVDAEDVLDEARAAISRHPGEPVFLFLHFYDVHYPYEAPGAFETRFDRAGGRDDPEYKKYTWYLKHPVEAEQLEHQIAQYDEEIAYVDDQLRRLMAAFAEAGREPWILVTADHGEEFGERGSWGHGHTLGPEQLHVPFLLAGPGIQPGVVDTVVGTQDIAATLAALAGARHPDSDGVDLLDGPLAERAFVSDTSRFETNRMGLYSEGLRLDWDLAQDRLALYADPGELTDVGAQRPEDTQRLRELLVTSLGQPWSAQPGSLSSEGRLVTEAAASSELTLSETTSFAVVPLDASIRHGQRGPWSIQDPPPEDAPLSYAGPRAGLTTLSEADRARLEALGYLQ